MRRQCTILRLCRPMKAPRASGSSVLLTASRFVMNGTIISDIFSPFVVLFTYTDIFPPFSDQGQEFPTASRTAPQRREATKSSHSVDYGPAMMEHKRELEAKDLIFDIRAGMTDSQIMEKYRLSFKGLQSALRKLLNVQAISPEELYERLPLYEVMTVDDMRQLVRAPLEFDLPIYEMNNPSSEGRVRNVTEQGVGVAGIEVRVGDTKTLTIEASEIAAFDAIAFNAQCRWVKKKVSGEYVAGFEITRITKENLDRLRQLIQGIGLDD